MDSKAMTTLMASNLKLLSDTSPETVDATMYHQMICSLMYLTGTNICLAVNTLRHVHLMVAKHGVRYLKGTVDYRIKYEVNQKINMEGYVDSYWEVPLIGRTLQSVASLWDQV